MEEIFVALALLISTLSLGISLAAFHRPQPAPAAAPAAAPEEVRRERELNQGVENILSYSVRLGRGQSTGGEPL